MTTAKTNHDLLEDFLTNCNRRYLRPATVKAYRDRLNTFVRHIDGRELGTVDRNIVEDWLDQHSRCAQSRHSYRSALIQWYDWLADSDLGATNPARQTAKPRVPKGRPRPLPTRDVSLAIGNATPRMGAILCLAAYAGLRCAEIAQLHATDVDLDDGWLVVQDGKGGKPRTMPMHPQLVAALTALPLPVRGHVIRSATGLGFRPRGISVMIRQHLTRLEIEGSAHRFRHWFATSAADSGADIMTIKELLGHSSVATTQIYVGWAMRRGRDAVDAIPRAS